MEGMEWNWNHQIPIINNKLGEHMSNNHKIPKLANGVKLASM